MYGDEGEYRWVDRLGDARSLLEELPEIVVGRRAAITAFDSGSVDATEEELGRGWLRDGDIVITSLIASYDDVARGVSDEFSELWIFGADEAVPSFSNWMHLASELRVITLAAPNVAYPDGPATWDPESWYALSASNWPRRRTRP